MTAPLPLSGIRVMDLTRALAGPYCTALLGDLGAEVIKVESSRGGDVTRAWPPFDGDHSLYFESVNRNKRSVAVDFYTDAGKTLLRRLALSADVVVENFRGGVMADLGLDPESLRAEKPELVVASVSAFGSSGPLAGAAGLDQVAQAMSGLMSVTGPDAEHPFRFGVPIIDMTSGIFCALGIVASLAGRGVRGEGATVSTSLLESALALSAFHGQQFLSTGAVPHPHGNDHASLTPYGVFHASDLPVVVAVGNDKQWLTLCGILGAQTLADDDRFSTGRLRTQHRDELIPALERLFGAQPAAHWLEAIRSAGIPCGPIYTYDQAFADEQVVSLDMVVQTTRTDGSALPLLRGPISIDGSATPIRFAPPDLGVDTKAVLDELALVPSPETTQEVP